MTDWFWGPFQFSLQKAVEPESETVERSQMTHAKVVSWNLNNISMGYLKSSPKVDVYDGMEQFQKYIVKWKTFLNSTVGYAPICVKRGEGIYVYDIFVCMKVKVAQSRPTLCDPMNYIACQAPLSMEFSRPEYWSG